MKAKISQQQAKQSTGYTVFIRETVAECQNGVKWLKGMPNSQESVEWSGGRQTGIKAPSNQDRKEGSQERIRREPSERQDIGWPVTSRGRLVVRRAS